MQGNAQEDVEAGPCTKVEIGKPAPDFCLTDQKEAPWQLSAKLGKVIALIFYPRDETLVCTRQLCSVRDRWDDYTATGAQIVAISPDNIQSHQEFALKHKLPISLLSDEGNRIARQYVSHWLYPISFTRGLVVIDAEGIVRSRTIMSRVFRPMDSKVISMIRLAQLARHGIVLPGWSSKSA